MIFIKLKSIWKYKGHLKIELIAFFLILPGFLQFIAVSIFELEKACRVNLIIEAEVCENLNNVPYKKMCSLLNDHSSKLIALNLSDSELVNKKIEIILQEGYQQESILDVELIEKSCDAEKDSQKLISSLYALRLPVSTFFILIIVSFGGALSDKFKIRKFFILLPFIGEILSIFTYVIAAANDSLPVEYPIMIGKILSSILGGQTLFMIGASSYMTVMTTEEHRTVRFGFFTMFTTWLGIIASPLSGFFFNNFSYIGRFEV